MSTKLNNALGAVYITDDVISSLAGLCTVGCYGIVGMASKRATDGIVELLGIENLSRGVKVTTNGDEALIELFVIVEYGISIAEVARNIIDTVRYQVESQTGVRIPKVNIMVEGVRVQQ